MWELIQANKRKSFLLFISMGVCLLALGYVIGAAFALGDGGAFGVLIAFNIWAILSLISFFAGDRILLGVSHAQEVSHDVHPQLFNIVEEMKIAANLPAIPKVYIIDDQAPNAFATGRNPKKSAIAVTTGLLSKLNRDELQGVIAHEMSHVMNRDVLFITFAGILLGSIILISDAFLRGGRHLGGSSRRFRASSSSRAGGQAQVVIILIAIVFAILAPILARLFYFALSRKREYLADASGVRLTRYPEGLASALEKISSSDVPLTSANRVTAPMYIVNPLQQSALSLTQLMSTHPPIEERIAILRSMSHGVNYLNYQQAYSAVTGKTRAMIPASGLKDSNEISIRQSAFEKQMAQGARTTARDMGDLIRAVNRFAFLTCVCGLKIKVPPDFKKPNIACPRCGQSVEVPAAVLQAVGAVVGVQEQEKYLSTRLQAGPNLYARKAKGWESFSCSCGKLLQISPKFVGTYVVCDYCGAKTEIRS